MKANKLPSIVTALGAICLVVVGVCLFFQGEMPPAENDVAKAKPIPSKVTVVEDNVAVDENIELCQGFGRCGCAACSGAQQVVVAQPIEPVCNDGCYGNVAPAGYSGRRGYGQDVDVRPILGVNKNSNRSLGLEPRWQDSQAVPWESFSYGEYIGPYRAPHVPEYRLRVADQLEFVYTINRQVTQQDYQINVGDLLQIISSGDSTLNQPAEGNALGGLEVLSDGTISLQLVGLVRAAGKTVDALQEELNDRYSEFVKKPAFVVQVVASNTPIKDLIDSVTAVAGAGGQIRQATVSPDGTIQLPLVGSVPAIGLSLREIQREIEARYRLRGIGGIVVTPTLFERAPTFIYVLGEVTTPGRFELTGPTSSIEAIALAEGFLQGGNLRQIVVFRRDANWNLVATRLDLSGALWGRRPSPSDEIWLRDGDIVLVPKRPIQRLSETVDLYLTTTLYAIFPEELIFDLDFVN